MSMFKAFLMSALFILAAAAIYVVWIFFPLYVAAHFKNNWAYAFAIIWFLGLLAFVIGMLIKQDMDAEEDRRERKNP